MRKLSDQELAKRIREGNRKRAETRRVKMTTAGMVQTVVWLPAELRQAIDTRLDRRTLSETVAELLAAGLRSSAAPPASYATAEPVPADRAELAKIGHGWREEGATLEGIAERFNAKAWTPDRIPKEPGTKPRADASKAWSSKTVSQLLSRDYPLSQN